MAHGSTNNPDPLCQDPAENATLACTVGAEPAGDSGSESSSQLVGCSGGCQAALERDRCVTKVRRLNKFIDQVLAGLPPTAAALWLTLFRFERKGRAQVSQETLGRLLGVDAKTIRRNIRILRQKPGTLAVLKAGQKGKEPTIYRLGLNPLPSRRKPRRPKKSGPPRNAK